jgi:hypothetical protein
MTKQMIALLPFMIRHCPKLHELSLSFHINMEVNTLPKPPPMPPELEAIYAAPHSQTSMRASPTFSYTDIPLPPIRALRISCTVSPSALPKNLIRIWPGVRHLEVSGAALQELCLNPRPSAADLETSFDLQLYEFQTGRSTKKGPPVAAQTFRASLKNSIGTLKILDLNGISDGLIGCSDQLFKEHGPHLRSLRLPNIARDIELPFLRHCTALEEIVVNGYPPKAVMVSCPVAKIQHASFTALAGQAKLPIEPVLDWLRSLSSLSVLTWSMRRLPDITRQNDDMALLNTFCIKRNVRMRTISMFETEVRKDHCHIFTNLTRVITGRAHRTIIVSSRRARDSIVALTRRIQFKGYGIKSQLYNRQTETQVFRQCNAIVPDSRWPMSISGYCCSITPSRRPGNCS